MKHENYVFYNCFTSVRVGHVITIYVLVMRAIEDEENLL